jgi:hypothetical protein
LLLATVRNARAIKSHFGTRIPIFMIKERA